MSKNLSAGSRQDMQKIIQAHLQASLLFNGKRRGDHWWFEGDTLRGIKIFEYSPGILRLSTMYAASVAHALPLLMRPLVRSERSYEISFRYQEAATVIPWALDDMVLAGGKPTWAYDPYWIRLDDGHAYLWTIDGWKLAEKQRQRTNVWPYKVPVPQAPEDVSA